MFNGILCGQCEGQATNTKPGNDRCDGLIADNLGDLHKGQYDDGDPQAGPDHWPDHIDHAAVLLVSPSSEDRIRHINKLIENKADRHTDQNIDDRLDDAIDVIVNV